MSSNRRWINTRVVMDMTTGAVLSRDGFFYHGPLALAEGKSPEEQLKELTATLEQTAKGKDEAIAESAKLRKQIAELSGKVLSEEDRKAFDELRKQAAATEEERKKKAGEFETLKAEMATKHENELKERDSKLSTLSSRFKQTVIHAEFGRATELFGGDGAKTILDVDLAIAALGGYVHIEDDEHAALGYRVVVKKANGTPIIGSDGNPKPFAEAMHDLIATLPNKDRILRGSGKTGSGSSGGPGSHQADLDLDALTKLAATGNKDAIAKLRERQQGLGGMVKGSAFAGAQG